MCPLKTALPMLQRPVSSTDVRLRLQVVLLKDFNVFDDKQLERAVSRSNLVINLLGMDKETMNFTFEDVHIEAAKKIANAAKNNGGILERYLHVSCLAASPEHPSRRLRTKVFHATQIRE